jgi:hypothetical protein
MSFVKKIITQGSILIGLCLLMVTGVFANPEDDLWSNGSDYSLSATGAAVFKNGNVKTINSYSELSSSKQKLDMKYEEGKLYLRFGIIGDFSADTINVSAFLFPSQLKMFKGRTLVGKVETCTSSYELVSLRIENDSMSHTLLKPNLYMEGHKVLTVGILNQKTKDIYYLQQVVDDINFDQMLISAENNYIQKKIQEQELATLELKYFRLESQETKVGTFSNNKFKVTENVDKNETQTKQSLPSSLGDLIYRVPDSIYKTGDFDKWYQKKDFSAQAPYAYNYIAYRFAGTENRLTYLIFTDIVIQVNWESRQKFITQVTVRDNVSVIYNVYTGELGLFGDDNRITLSELSLKFKSNTENGVFISRTHTGSKSGSKFGNIVRAILAWVPYASTIVSSIDYLTAADQTRTGTDNTYYYHDTAEAQRDAYGKLINQIVAEDSSYVKKGDNMALIVEGNAINSLRLEIAFNVSYQ